MRDPAGQAAHGLHLLRLTQLLFQGATLGDILREEFEDHAFFTAVDHGTPRDSHDAGAALALPVSDYSFERFRGAQAIRQLEPLFGIVVEAVDVMATQFVSRTKPKQFEECRIGIQNLASRVATANSVRCIGNERTKICLRNPQIFLDGAQRTVEPADQNCEKREQRQAQYGDAHLLGCMLTRERKVGNESESEGSGDQPRFPAAIPGAHHDGYAEQGQAAFGNIGQQNRGNQRQCRAEHGNSVAQYRRTGRRNAE